MKVHRYSECPKGRALPIMNLPGREPLTYGIWRAATLMISAVVRRRIKRKREPTAPFGVPSQSPFWLSLHQLGRRIT